VDEEEQLRVADARQRDIGHGKVRIDNKIMNSLGISTGDFVEVDEKKVTVPRAALRIPEILGVSEEQCLKPTAQQKDRSVPEFMEA